MAIDHRTPGAAPSRAALRSSIGRKAVMAVTGLLLFLFVVVHMLGNLKIFTGPRHFDDYAGFLREIGGAALGHGWYLWAQRTVLLVALLLHIAAAYSVARQSARARPVRYERPATVAATYASRTMRWGGIIVGLFIIYHLLDLTTGTVHPDFHQGQVYANVVADFRVWYVTLAYAVAVAALGLHLDHGLWSAAQTLGGNRPGREHGLRLASRLVALAIVVGYLSVPVAVMIGIID